jgi:voltage-gated potassium channel Kch
MPSKIHRYAKEITKRFAIFGILLIIAFSFHRIFSIINEEIIGAIIFIIGFSAGAMYYYFNLFKQKDRHTIEFIISIIFVFSLTITMFAVIYSEPIENSNNYFMEFGQPTILSFPDAFYFSTTTITTLGYGDITPVGVFRFFVIIEVFMGLIYTGSMIYYIVEIFGKKEK